MIWFGIIAIIFFGVGIIIRDSHMGNPLAGKFGALLYYVSLIMFAILVIVSIIGGIRQRGDGSSVPAPVRQSAAVPEALTFILPIAQANYVPIRDFNIPDPELDARAAILVDARSSRVLYARNAHERLPIASITKLMSAMVILDHLDLQDTYEVAAEDLNLDGMGADFAQSDRFRGADLFSLMLVKSSNDAASVFATAAYRNGLDFVALMNAKARSLGMTDTHFSDPAGLNDSETYSTASDVVALLRAAKTYPKIVSVLRSRELAVSSLGGRTYRAINTDQLLATLSGITIGKTGNTTGAKGTLALAVSVDGTDDELLAVILGSNRRFAEMAELIAWGKKAHSWEKP